MKLSTNWWIQIAGVLAQGAIAAAGQGLFGPVGTAVAAVAVGGLQLGTAIKAHHSTVKGNKLTPPVVEAIAEKAAPAVVANIAQQVAVKKLIDSEQ